MAKKKKKSHSTRRRSMGALNPSGPIVKLATLAAGYFLGDTINAQIDKILPASLLSTTTSAGIPDMAMKYAVPAVEIGVGGYLLMSKKKPSMIKTVAGGIIAGAGLRKALKAAGIVSGYQAVPVIGKRRVAGYQSVPVLGGVPSQLSGGASPFSGPVPNQLSGYRVNGYRPNGSKVLGGVGDWNGGSGLLSHSGLAS